MVALETDISHCHICGTIPWESGSNDWRRCSCPNPFVLMRGQVNGRRGSQNQITTLQTKKHIFKRTYEAENLCHIISILKLEWPGTVGTMHFLTETLVWGSLKTPPSTVIEFSTKHMWIDSSVLSPNPNSGPRPKVVTRTLGSTTAQRNFMSPPFYLWDIKSPDLTTNFSNSFASPSGSGQQLSSQTPPPVCTRSLSDLMNEFTKDQGKITGSVMEFDYCCMQFNL